MARDETINEERISHPIAPVYDSDSRILILGSFPSVKSRETGFFYGHKQNRFWAVTSTVCNCPVPVTLEEKKMFLLQNRIALWDVIASCNITGSSDSSIRDAAANDISVILNTAKIKAVFTNGNTSNRLYKRFLYPTTGMEATYLPSTSPANAAAGLEKLIKSWKIIGEYL